MSGHINVKKCVEYLRSVGVFIREDTASLWAEQEAAYRAGRRAARRELKRSCGHFSTHETSVYWDDGSEIQTICNACGVVLSRRPIDSPPPTRRKRIVRAVA